MQTTSQEQPLHSGPLAIIGGYGLVGRQAVRLLRERNPDLPLVLGGRDPQRAGAFAEEIGATLTSIDVCSEWPLRALPDRPAAVTAVVSDPQDRLLVHAMREGIPIADINRAGHVHVLDATLHAAREQPRAAVLLAGSWMSGLTALAAAAVVAELDFAERVDINVLVSSADRVGQDSWGFSDRLAWPYQGMEHGSRRPVHPLTESRLERCADGLERQAVRVSTLEQLTLPITLGIGTVETRMALDDRPALWGLVALKRTGILRLLDRPNMRGARNALLRRSGSGDLAGFAVTATGPGGSVSVDVLDIRGQAHLSAVGAVAAAERLLGEDKSQLPPGICFIEQFADPAGDFELLERSGVVVRWLRPTPKPSMPTWTSAPTDDLNRRDERRRSST